ETGKVVEAPESVAKAVDENWSADWKKYGTFDDTFYAAPMLANLKGYVWYSAASFRGWGGGGPESGDGTMGLPGTIRAKTGQAPSLPPFARDAAPGSPGTDGLPDLVLRQSAPDVSGRWLDGDVPATAPEIKQAFDTVGTILLNPDYVNAGFGDVKSINSTAFA